MPDKVTHIVHIALTNGKTVTVKGNVAHMQPEKVETTPAMLVVKEQSWSSNIVAEYPLSQVLGYTIEDIEEVAP